LQLFSISCLAECPNFCWYGGLSRMCQRM